MIPAAIQRLPRFVEPHAVATPALAEVEYEGAGHEACPFSTPSKAQTLRLPPGWLLLSMT